MLLQTRIAKVTVDHILKVVEEIRTGKPPVPPRRHARKWHLRVSGKQYPTKYVLGRAIEIATPREGKVLAAHFSGGEFTVNILNRILKGDARFEIR